MDKHGRQFPFFGCAPGGYLVMCPDCQHQFMGDKRASRCLPCAVAEEWDEADRALKHERELENNWS